MRLAAALLLCVAARADLRLLVHDRQGNFLRESVAVARTGGYAYAPREALYGAATRDATVKSPSEMPLKRVKNSRNPGT